MAGPAWPCEERWPEGVMCGQVGEWAMWVGGDGDGGDGRWW